MKFKQLSLTEMKLKNGERLCASNIFVVKYNRVVRGFNQKLSKNTSRFKQINIKITCEQIEWNVTIDLNRLTTCFAESG